MENGTQAEGKDPSSFLSEIIGNAVTVKLNSGVVYKGDIPLISSVAFRVVEDATDPVCRGTAVCRRLHEHRP